jgi:uncharacterized protein
MLGTLTDSQIEYVLQTQFVGRIGCYSGEKIYVVPVTYVYDKGYIYVRSKEGEKVRAMRKHPKVCFQVDAIENMANWRSVIIWGEYQELKTEAEQREGMKLLLDKLAPFMISETVGPSHQSHAPEIVEKGFKAVAYRIKVLEKSGRFEKN